MRFKQIGSLGVLCTLGASMSFGQFAAQRGAPVTPLQARPTAQPSYPSMPGGIEAAPPTQGGLQQTGFSTPATQRHPWAVSAQHGAWMICVKSYAGSDSRKQAEGLTKVIRDVHKVAAYVYERNGEERRRELAQIEAIKRQAEIDNAPFLQVMEQAKKQAEATGSVFEPTAPPVKIPRPANPTPEQWAVLIGGFPTDEAARNALDIVRRLAPPKDPALLDVVATPTKDGSVENKYLNPFVNAMVIPNPEAKKAASDTGKLDPFIVKLNEDEPLSLLKARKPWTILVRSFTAPIKVVNEEEESKSVFDRLRIGKEEPSYLMAMAGQASQLASALRDPKMEPQPLTAFVLHHRTGSIVCIGEFDAPDDPNMLAMQKQIQKMMTFEVKSKDGRVIGREKMFDSTSAFPVPRQ